MTTIDATLRDALGGAGDDLTLRLDPAFQGLPDAAHGGSVLGLFDLLAARTGPRTVRGRYLRRVPVGVPLSLTLTRATDTLACRVIDRDGALLVDGGVTAGGPADPERHDAPGRDAMPLPVSLTCFACGIHNPHGLRARLTFDAHGVGGAWTPPTAFRADAGRLSPVALTTLLDEAAFWLGALASGEAGMTTELTVTLHDDARADDGVVVGGERAATRPRADDPRYWDTSVSARDATGRPLATAAITFVAVRGAARNIVSGLLAMNPPEVMRRVFPAYCA